MIYKTHLEHYLLNNLQGIPNVFIVKAEVTTSENGSYYLFLLHSRFVFSVALFYPCKRKLLGQTVI